MISRLRLYWHHLYCSFAAKITLVQYIFSLGSRKYVIVWHMQVNRREKIDSEVNSQFDITFISHRRSHGWFVLEEERLYIYNPWHNHRNVLGNLICTYVFHHVVMFVLFCFNRHQNCLVKMYNVSPQLLAVSAVF